jgi:hypothetical protein
LVKRLLVFHDESEPPGAWLFVGLLWAMEAEILPAARRLVACRERTGYWKELHFHKLSGYAPRRDLAYCWFDIADKHLLGPCKFYALAVNKSPPHYDGRRFPKDFLAYNRFTSMALWNSFRLYWRSLPSSEIVFVSDEKGRALPRGYERSTAPWDNFEEYIPYRFARYHANRVGPVKPFDVTVSEPPHRIVRVVPMAVRKERTARDWDEREELLQLCDLLLGSVAQAFTGASKKPDKKYLGKRATKMIRASEPASPGPNPYFARFHVACFPDQRGYTLSARYPLGSDLRDRRRIGDFGEPSTE